MENQSVDQWMKKNKLTSLQLALAIRYSPGAAAKWRQELTVPEDRAIKAIARAGKRRGWTEFPIPVSKAVA